MLAWIAAYIMIAVLVTSLFISFNWRAALCLIGLTILGVTLVIALPSWRYGWAC